MEYDDYCDECGQRYDRCQCQLPEPTSLEENPPSSDELWAAYRASGDEADLPF